MIISLFFMLFPENKNFFENLLFCRSIRKRIKKHRHFFGNQKYILLYPLHLYGYERE